MRQAVPFTSVPIDVPEGFVKDWLGDEAEAMRDALEEDRNVAVVSEPFGGRERVVEYASESLETEVGKKRFEPLHENNPQIEADDEGVHLYQDGHHLYTRCIDGFGCLDVFLDEVASGSGTVISSWNVFAWRYVSRVRDADEVFPVVIEVPSLDSELLDRLLSEGKPPRSEEYIEEKGSSFVTREIELPFFEDKSVKVPWRLDHEEMSPREVAIEHVRSESNGNPGVAEVMWEDMMSEGYEAVSEGGEVAEDESRSLVDSFGKSKEGFDDSTAFVLRTVVSKEEVSKDELRETAGIENVERKVHSLSSRGFVSAEDGIIELEPKRMPGIISILKERSTLW